MVFDAAFRPEKQSAGATQASSDLFNRIHDEKVGIRQASATGGALEPPGQGVIEPPPTQPPTKPPVERPPINISPKGGDANANASARAAASAKSSSQASSESIGPNISSKSIYTAPPSFGGGDCSTAVSGGAFGFALGFETPNMDCVREKTGAEKDGQMLDFTVNSGRAAADIMDQALTNVDKAHNLHQQGSDGVAQAHLEGANAQRQISGHLAAESTTAATRVLGPDSSGGDAGGWNAGILNDNSPPPAAAPEAPPPPSRHTHRQEPPKHIVPKKDDCK